MSESATKPGYSSTSIGSNGTSNLHIPTACEDERRMNINRKRPLSAVEWHSALYDSTGKAVVLLKVQGAPDTKRKAPVIREGAPIVGNVELNFSKPEYVEEVFVTVSTFYPQMH